MILVDTSVWVRHFRVGDARLPDLLDQHQVSVHPWIIGELALGSGFQPATLADLNELPTLPVIDDDRLLEFIQLHAIRGIGWVDLQLLVAAMSARVTLWTDDKKLAALADRFEIGT